MTLPTSLPDVAGSIGRHQKGAAADPMHVDWQAVIRGLRAERPDIYRAWFEALPNPNLSRGEVIITAPDDAQAYYLSEHCRDALINAIMRTTGHLLSVRVRSAGLDRGPVFQSGIRLTTSPLLPDHTFTEFVVGPSNQLAHAACAAVCFSPGTLYNPLFVHGASGLGKTHLLQAICSEIQRLQPGVRVAYLSCEDFVNDLVRAMAAGEISRFRDATRSIDVLAIDDVQFLANRESSQEEMFHTFNALHQARKQIVLTADAPPARIPTLEDRLVSRFNWGLLTQLDPPCRETRQAILQRKAQLRSLNVPAEVLDYIAEHIEGNTRLLEGALTSLVSTCQLNHQPLSIETARQVLGQWAKPNLRPILLNEIVDAVVKHYGIRASELLGRRRTRSLAHPRRIAIYLARKLTSLSLDEIGKQFSGRDHSTILHAEQTVANASQDDPELAQHLQSLERQLLDHRRT